MLCLSRKTEYALLALGYLAERPGRIVGARDLAVAYALPTALLMNILKTLQQHRLLVSRRGMRGGYQVGADLERVSLHDLIRMLEGKVEAGCDHERGRGSAEAPIAALHFKMMQFLRDVSLADLVMRLLAKDPDNRLPSARQANSKGCASGRPLVVQR